MISKALSISPLPGALPAATQDTALISSTHTITLTDGTKPFTAFVVTGFNGGGTGLNQINNVIVDPVTGTIVLTGTPTAPGNVSFMVNAIDAAGGKLVSQLYTMVVNPPLLLSATTLPPTDVGQTYGSLSSQTVTVTQGSPAYTMSILNFHANGTGLASPTVSNAAGTMTFNSVLTASGSVDFDLKVVDLAGAMLTQHYVITVNPKLAFAGFSQATVGTPYSKTVTVTGGTAAYSAFSASLNNANGTGITGGNITTNSGAQSVTVAFTPTGTGDAAIAGERD